MEPDLGPLAPGQSSLLATGADVGGEADLVEELVHLPPEAPPDFVAALLDALNRPVRPAEIASRHRAYCKERQRLLSRHQGHKVNSSERCT